MPRLRDRSEYQTWLSSLAPRHRDVVGPPVRGFGRRLGWDELCAAIPQSALPLRLQNLTAMLLVGGQMKRAAGAVIPDKSRERSVYAPRRSVRARFSASHLRDSGIIPGVKLGSSSF